jgi:hypothetical protein
VKAICKNSRRIEVNVRIGTGHRAFSVFEDRPYYKVSLLQALDTTFPARKIEDCYLNSRDHAVSVGFFTTLLIFGAQAYGKHRLRSATRFALDVGDYLSLS